MTSVPLEPYGVGILFFIITYILITAPVYPGIVGCMDNSLQARFIIALIIAALAFTTVAYILRRDTTSLPPQ